MFRFASPWLLLLAAVPWIWWLLQLRHHGTARHSPALFVASLTGDAPPVTPGIVASRLMPLVTVIAVTLMIIALARPQAGEHKVRTTSEGINIVLALDLSESMRALDFTREDKIVTRLDAVKGVVKDFIMERQGDRIGLVVFGSNAFTQLPLTRDYDTISFMLDHLTIGAAGPKTAIGDAIGISLKRLTDIKARSNIIILLTDGKSNAGSLSWADAAGLAKAKNVKIYTVGVGTRGKVPFLVNGIFGKQYVYQQVDMDWEALEKIATQTSGRFFKASDTEGLKQIYELINTMEKTQAAQDKWVSYQELYPRFLIPGLILYLACLLLSNTRLLRVP